MAGLRLEASNERTVLGPTLCRPNVTSFGTRTRQMNESKRTTARVTLARDVGFCMRKRRASTRFLTEHLRWWSILLQSWLMSSTPVKFDPANSSTFLSRHIFAVLYSEAHRSSLKKKSGVPIIESRSLWNSQSSGSGFGLIFSAFNGRFQTQRKAESSRRAPTLCFCY